MEETLKIRSAHSTHSHVYVRAMAIHHALKNCLKPIRALWNWSINYSGAIIIIKAIPPLMILAALSTPYLDYILCAQLSLMVNPLLSYVIYVTWLIRWGFISLVAIASTYRP